MMTFDTGDSRESPDNTPAREYLYVTLCSRIFVEVGHTRGPDNFEEGEHELHFEARRIFTGFAFINAEVTLVVQRHNVAGWTPVERR